MDQTEKEVEQHRGVRTCGACHACCVIPAIDEPGFEKLAGVRCSMLDSGGLCSIYPRRPATCRAFRCGWLAGILPESAEFRPEQLGVMLKSADVEGEEVLQAWEVRKGASQQPLARQVLALLAADEVVMVIDSFAPDQQVEILGPLASCETLLRLIGRTDILAAILPTAPRTGVISISLPLDVFTRIQ